MKMNLLHFYDWMQGRVRVGDVPEGFDQPCLHWLMSVDAYGSPKACNRPLARAWGYSGSSIPVRRAAYKADDYGRRDPISHRDYIIPACESELCVEPSHMIVRTAAESLTGRKRSLATLVRMSLSSGASRSPVPNEAVPGILLDPRPTAELAAEWGCSVACISDIRAGRTRVGARMQTGPFAQLLR